MEDTGTASAVADAPTSTSAPLSAPSTSAPASEPTPTTNRPSFKTALDVFDEAAKAQGRKPRVQQPQAAAIDPSVPTPDGTATPAAPVAAAPSPKGPIPFDVHDTVLKNARAKERQVVEQEFRSQIGGDLGVAQTAMRWFQEAGRDRAAFVRNNVNEALADPQLRQEVLSIAARALGSQRQPSAGPVSAEMPQPDFQDGAGNKFYSAPQQEKRDAWLTEKLKADILGQVQPDLDQVRSEREARQAETAQRQTVAAIHSHISEAKKLPYFGQFQQEIAAAAKAMPLTSGHPAEEAIVLQRAYWQVVGPQLSRLEQQRVIADLKARANASSLNPASTGAPSGIPKNVRAKDGGTFGNALAWAQTQTSGR